MTCPPVGISVHDGDWHTTADNFADNFNEWVATWFKLPPTPLSTRLSIGYQNVILRSLDGMFFRGLETIPEIAAAGRKFGVDHLSLWDYITAGNYARPNNLDVLDYTQREKDTIRKGLAQAKAEGTNVSALINFRLGNPMSSAYNQAEAVRNLDGSPRIENWAGSSYHYTFWTPYLGPVGHVLSPRSESWCRRVYRQTKEYLELGFTSMFYDQPFQVHPDYSKQEHGEPDEVLAACQDVIAEVRNMLVRNDPEAYMIGEQCSVHTSQYIDVWMSWYNGFEPVERTAFAIPYTINSYPIDGSAWKASKAFALGLQLCLCTCGNEQTLQAKPEFAEHVAKLAALRKRCAARTVLGRFRHTLSLHTELDEGLCAYAYDSSEGPAVIIAAGGKGGCTDIEVDKGIFHKEKKGASGTLFFLDGGQKELANTDKFKCELAPNEVIVAYC